MRISVETYQNEETGKWSWGFVDEDNLPEFLATSSEKYDNEQDVLERVKLISKNLEGVYVPVVRTKPTENGVSIEVVG